MRSDGGCKRVAAAAIGALAIGLMPARAAGEEIASPGPPQALDRGRCVDPAIHQRIAEVEVARARKDPFPPGPIPIPPILVADTERTFWWALLLYLQSTNVEEGTSTRLVVPFYLSLCRPESETVITPLFGYRRDDAGIAGFALTYFGRRDALADSDVIFPLVWWFRERDVPGGPTVRHFAAVPPLYFSAQNAKGEHYRFFPPLYWHWGDADQTTTILATYFQREDGEGWDAGLVPLYFAGQRGDASYRYVPPLVWHRSDADGSATLAGPVYYASRRDGFTLAVPPLVFAGRRGAEHHTVVAPLFWRFGNATQTTTVAGNVFYREEPGGWDFGVVPLYFGGDHKDRSYHLLNSALHRDPPPVADQRDSPV